MKRKILVVTISFVMIGAVCAYFLLASTDVGCEKVVEFTYTRTQPCNTEYYDYGFSIGPLHDLFLRWRGAQEASQVDFLDRVKSRLKTFPEVLKLKLADTTIDELIRRVDFSLVKGCSNENPIRCRMVVCANDERGAVLVARAFMQTMLHDMELENESMSWKATMDKGCAFKSREQELLQLRKRIAVTALRVEESEKLKAAISDAEQSVSNAKVEWDAAIKAYRAKWDASLVFQKVGASKCSDAADLESDGYFDNVFHVDNQSH